MEELDSLAALERFRDRDVPATAGPGIIAVADGLSRLSKCVSRDAANPRAYARIERLETMMTKGFTEQKPLPSDAAGWDGWRSFIVVERLRESDTITSFFLKPEDGKPLPLHRPGQYLTLLIDVPGCGETQRTYSISNGPNSDAYRISVKREADGTVSRHLHDAVPVGTALRVSAPAGDFVLPADRTKPVVLVSAGVGLTPMVSILTAAADDNLSSKIFYVHGTRDSSSHAMRDHARSIAMRQPMVSLSTFYSSPRTGDIKGDHFEEEGRISVAWLRAHTPAEAEFMICGPASFLRDMVGGLISSGIPAAHIHYEFFGAVGELLEKWPEALDVVPPSGPASASPSPPARLDSISKESIGDALLHSNADAVIVSDRGGAIVLWSPGAERIFGFAESEALGQSLDLITPESLRARHWAGYHNTVSTGRSRYGAGELLAVPAMRKDGKRLSIEFTITMLKDTDQQVTGMIAVLRDVTARFEEVRALKKKISDLGAA